MCMRARVCVNRKWAKKYQNQQINKQNDDGKELSRAVDEAWVAYDVILIAI